MLLNSRSSNTSSGVFNGWRVPRPCSGVSSVADHQQVLGREQQAAGRHFKGQTAAAGIVFRALPDQEQVVGMKLDARHLVRVQRRGQRVLVELEVAVQQVALGGIGVAEQHHLGVQSFDRAATRRGSVRSCLIIGAHHAWPRRLSSRRRTNSSSTSAYRSSCK